MKGSKSLIAISVAVTLALIPSAIAAPKTTVKAAGRVTTTVVNTILNGVGAPSKTLGINGDFYIDTKNLVLYGPKINGSWKNSSSLKQAEAKSVTTVIGEGGAVGDKGAQGDKGDKGATGNTGATGAAGLSGAVGPAGSKGNDGAAGAMGASGATGSIGATGASGSNGSNGATGASGSTGATGSRGDTGLTGSTGATGAQGVKGDAGTAGLDGATGATGAQGIQGIKGDAGTAGTAGTNGTSGAQGIQGVQGDAGAAGTNGSSGAQGIQGIKGDVGNTGEQGIQGIQGIKGDVGNTGEQGIQGIQGVVGTTGAAGISISKFASIPNISLETSITGNSNSEIFFIAAADGNYTFDILVAGSVQVAVDYKLNAEIIVGPTAIASQFVVASDAVTYANKLAGRQYGFHIIGVAAGVTTGTSFAIRITIQIGAGSSTVYFNGRALINKVGSIG
jgi:hypothetical protein